MDKWELPDKFRLTKEVIAAADEQQVKWREELNTPFANLSPQARMRGRATMTAVDPGVSPSERCEAYVTLGRFDLVAEVPGISMAEQLLAESYLHALERSDDEWCDHPQPAQFVEREVYSIRHRADAYLLCCNTCGFRNLVPALPEHIADGRRKRAESRRIHQGMTPLQVKRGG